METMSKVVEVKEDRDRIIWGEAGYAERQTLLGVLGLPKQYFKMRWDSLPSSVRRKIRKGR